VRSSILKAKTQRLVTWKRKVSIFNYVPSVVKRCARNKQEAQVRLDNEEAAWDAAEEWLNVRLALTQDDLDDFNSRRNSCLATYKEKVAYFKKK
jgi:hypothetical protein